jgi:UDP-GlcNAc:undecaprenyl-phosphate/decaprenyl-phosphate GlcNAc-1-phosphate transferase
MPTHPSFEYLLVAAVAAAGSYLATPIARAIAVRWGAIARPRDRDVHAVAIPRLGGLALLVGLALALFTARQLPTLKDAFEQPTEIPWIVVAAGLIFLLGALDDRYELDSLTKLAGQVVASGIMVTLGGVQLTEIYLPWGVNNLELGQDLSIPVTIVLTVLTINAINFIDGLDGLAAGVTAIAALAFFIYSYHLGQGAELSIAAPPTLLAAVLAGTCVGFLPHNFFPARIFMGDSGSMLVGLMLSAAATTATTNATSTGVFEGAVGTLPLTLPLLIPLAVLALPFVDLVLAVIRRVGHGHSPFAPDKRHLHHRLLELGHSHRRAVLLLYFWSALLAFGGAAVSIFRSTTGLAWGIGCGAVVGLLLVVVPRLSALAGRRRRAAAGLHSAARDVNGVASKAAEPVPSSAVGMHAVVPGLSHPAREPLNESVAAPSSTQPSDDARRAI